MYIGISATEFDKMRKAGLVPAPRRQGERKLWDVRELDLVFDSLPRDDEEAGGNSWADV